MTTTRRHAAPAIIATIAALACMGAPAWTPAATADDTTPAPTVTTTPDDTSQDALTGMRATWHGDDVNGFDPTRTGEWTIPRDPDGGWTAPTVTTPPRGWTIIAVNEPCAPDRTAANGQPGPCGTPRALTLHLTGPDGATRAWTFREPADPDPAAEQTIWNHLTAVLFTTDTRPDSSSTHPAPIDAYDPGHPGATIDIRPLAHGMDTFATTSHGADIRLEPTILGPADGWAATRAWSRDGKPTDGPATADTLALTITAPSGTARTWRFTLANHPGTGNQTGQDGQDGQTGTGGQTGQDTKPDTPTTPGQGGEPGQDGQPTTPGRDGSQDGPADGETATPGGTGHDDGAGATHGTAGPATPDRPTVDTTTHAGPTTLASTGTAIAAATTAALTLAAAGAAALALRRHHNHHEM